MTEQVGGVGVLHVLAEYDHGQYWPATAQVDGGAQPLISERRRHPDVGDHQVRLVLRGGPATIPPPDTNLPLAAPGYARPDASQPYSGAESALGVLCSDSPNPRDPGQYAAQAAVASARSGVVGPDWSWITEACAKWPVLARDRFTGPFSRPTAAPILVVGNTVDPATPYRDSVAMSHELADARLLTVKGYGHTELANPSKCVARAEDSYYVTGTLPPAGTVCRQDALPFAG